jgi:hypothetical protein
VYGHDHPHRCERKLTNTTIAGRPAARATTADDALGGTETITVLRRSRHQPGGTADGVLRVGVQKNANSSRDDPGRDQLHREVAVEDEKPVDQFRIVRKPAFRMCLDAYPSIAATWLQAERRQQFVPGLGIDDRAP